MTLHLEENQMQVSLLKVQLHMIRLTMKEGDEKIVLRMENPKVGAKVTHQWLERVEDGFTVLIPDEVEEQLEVMFQTALVPLIKAKANEEKA